MQGYLCEWAARLEEPVLTGTQKDIDEKNLDHARRNIALNSLQSRIRPVRTSADGPLLPLDELGIDQSVPLHSPSLPTLSPCPVAPLFPHFAHLASN